MPFIAIDKNTGKPIDILEISNPHLTLKKSEFICQLCGEAMFLKAGPILRPHFSHFADCKSDYKTGHSETANHLFAKMELKRILRAQFSNLENIEIEYEVPIPEIKRVADVLVTFPMGWRMAHEIQLSSITLEDLEERTNDYFRGGIDVYWWLGESADIPSNRMWCVKKFGFSLSISFNFKQQPEPFSFSQIT